MLMNQVPENCAICGATKLTKYSQNCHDYLTGKFFQLVECDHCHTYQTITAEGKLSASSMAEYYDAEYYGSEKGKFSSLMETIFQFNHALNARRFYRRFLPENVLDVGCGRGYILRKLKMLGCNVTGLESPDAAEWIKNNPDIHVVPIDTSGAWPFPDESFDMIIIWHVLEHLENPVDTLQFAFQSLKEGGTICISVPNIDSFQAKLKLNTWFHLDVPRHLFHLTPQSLKVCLEKQGFEIKQLESGDMIQNLYGWLQSLLNCFMPGSTNLFYRFLQGGKPWQSAVDKVWIWPQLFLLPIWGSIACICYAIETLSGKHGTITVYAKKRDTECLS